MCRSRQELSNAYLLAKIGVDTAENEPLEVWDSIHHSVASLLEALEEGPEVVLLGRGLQAAQEQRRAA